MERKKPGPAKGTKHSDVQRSPFGMRLFKTRKARGMTQEELAQRLGITKRMVANYEGISEGPSIERLFQIADVLNVTASYLLGESTQKKIGQKVEPHLQEYIRLIRELSPKEQRKVLEYVEFRISKQNPKRK